LKKGKGQGRKKKAETEGFEPPVPHSTTVFKTAAFDRSATSPVRKYKYFYYTSTLFNLNFSLSDFFFNNGELLRSENWLNEGENFDN
jgi:hypothetical protein